MHPSPVTLLSIYLDGLCGIAYTGKPLSILVMQQELGVLLLHMLGQGRVGARQGPCFLKLVAQNVYSANGKLTLLVGNSAAKVRLVLSGQQETAGCLLVRRRGR